ncbi:hypothetical protein BGZ92_007532 [Podila epicladia]|nr:hypothetical protein BGZ92_007532 [Podila epicladia]
MERQFAKTAAYASAAVLSAAAYIDLSGKHGSPAGSTLALLSTFISFHYFGVQALYNGREAHGMRTYISSYDKEYPPDLPLYQVRSASGDLPEGSSSSSPALDSQPTVEENDKTYSTHPPPYQDIGQRKPPAQDLPEGSSSGLSTVSNHLILKKNK